MTDNPGSFSNLPSPKPVQSDKSHTVALEPHCTEPNPTSPPCALHDEVPQDGNDTAMTAHLACRALLLHCFVPPAIIQKVSIEFLSLSASSDTYQCFRPRHLLDCWEHRPGGTKMMFSRPSIHENYWRCRLVLCTNTSNC